MTKLDLSRVKGARLRRAIEKVIALSDELVAARDDGTVPHGALRERINEYEYAVLLVECADGDDE
jgi:hypothetical protein